MLHCSIQLCGLLFSESARKENMDIIKIRYSNFLEVIMDSTNSFT